MKHRFLFFQILFMVLLSCSCGQPNKRSDKQSSDSINRDTTTSSDPIRIIQGWTDPICMDSVYTLQIQGNSDSVDLFNPVIGKGGILEKKEKGIFEFRLKEYVDTLKIMIVKKTPGPSGNLFKQVKYQEFLIPVKK